MSLTWSVLADAHTGAQYLQDVQTKLPELTARLLVDLERGPEHWPRGLTELKAQIDAMRERDKQRWEQEMMHLAFPYEEIEERMLDPSTRAVEANMRKVVLGMMPSVPSSDDVSKYRYIGART